ncbi:unnamed protein product [Dovyalis caffra]|uniref:Uncharacterized protein n=1 Tax=Dovyalis caffra TaxID=77055 RepID=A0AAV1R3H1_9ROSI|nr:unnamed protein product [Dovyalis caffra]
MAEEDEWVKVAMDDDSLVVELLLKLNQPEQQQQQQQQLQPRAPGLRRRRRRRRFAGDLVKEGAVLALSVDWSVRQRRSSSKQVMMTRRKKGSDSSTRASPTTPLSFSGGTSVSGGGGGDGFDEATTSASLPVKLTATSRSKVAVTSETPTIKRSRKKKNSTDVVGSVCDNIASAVKEYAIRMYDEIKKIMLCIVLSDRFITLVELREEESLLLKERRRLKHKLATLCATVEEERARNESLKRIELDLLSQQRPKIFTASDKSDVISIQPQEIKVACDSTYSMLPHNVPFQLQEDEGRNPSFTLPDLNEPVEGDSGSGVLS